VGDGTDKPKLIAQAKGMRNVQFLEQVPNDAVSPMLRAADIGILHSRAFDAFTGARPNKLFDYMSAGLPIVCAVPGEAFALVQAAESGIEAEWENPSSIAKSITVLADEANLRRRLGSNGHAHVIEKHSREASSVALNRVLRQVERKQFDSKAVHLSTAVQES
jgi:glycosyltransferase involved in cell wall biosynthesis